jgi:nicotinamidase-related amidase
MSHMCIDATTRAAYDLGLKCTLIHDACATRDLEFQGKKVPADEVHASFMAALGWWYADLKAAADFLRLTEQGEPR